MKTTARQRLFQAGVDELQRMIEARWPGTQFRVEGSDPESGFLHVFAEFDLDEPPDLGPEIVAKELELLEERGTPILVLPVRSASRRAATPTPPARRVESIERARRKLARRRALDATG